MAKQKKLNGNKSSDKKSDRKDSRNANSKKAGTDTFGDGKWMKN